MESSQANQALGWDYWLQWQILVCALIFTLPAAIAVSLIRKRASSGLSSTDLWVPCWRNLHPRWLLFYRAFAFVAMAFLLYQTVAAFGFFVFFFYTQWTFALVMVYFALGTLVSARGCFVCSRRPLSRSGERDKFLKVESEDRKDANTSTSEDKAAKSEQHAGFLEYLMQMIYQICTPSYNMIAVDRLILHGSTVSTVIMSPLYFSYALCTLDNHSGDTSLHLSECEPGSVARYLQELRLGTCGGAVMLTDIVFWGLLLPFMTGENFKLTLLIGCMHSVNALLLILDSAVNNMPFSWFGIVYFVLWSVSYVVFQWTLHACCITWWPYPFLELSTPWAPLWYLALALVHIPCYGVYILLVKGKHAIFSRMFPHSFVRAPMEKKRA